MNTPAMAFILPAGIAGYFFVVVCLSQKGESMKLSLCGIAWILMLTLSACAQSNNSPQNNKALTPEEVAKKHGNLFNAGPPGQIQEQLAHTKGDVRLLSTISPEMGIDMPMEWKFANLACQNDLVVVAKASSGSSHPTANQGYIYTDWQFGVEEVLRDNSKAPVRAGATIVVTRPGGVLEIGGRKVYAKLDHFRDFVPNEKLLLYLRFVPETGAYSMFEPNYFGISDDILKLAREGVKAPAGNTPCGGAR